MTDVFLTHSYFLHFDPKEYKAMAPYPPLGTLYAASVLREKGFSVHVHDVMFAKEVESIRSELERLKPRMFVIYDDGFNYLTKMCLSRMREAAFEMAVMAKRAGCTVVVFSSDAVDHLSSYFDHSVDYVLCGEAEQTLEELADFLVRNTGSSPDHIRGLAFMRASKIHRTSPREVLRALDTLPFPAWDLADIEKYRRVWNRSHGYFSLNISTTRGCPFHCNWCAKPLYGQVYHSRSPEHVVAEMKYIGSVAAPDHLWITDDIFGLTPGWVEKFDELVRREQVRIPFKCLSRADLLVRNNTIQHLASAGCTSVWIGAESGSQKILDAMDKGTTVDQIYQATRDLHAHGVRVGFFLQFGYPGETAADIDLTLKMVRDCQPDEIGISVSYPLPGTPFYDRVEKEMGEKRNWTDSGDLDVMFAGEYSKEFYRILHRVVHKKFGLWRGIRTTRKWLRNPLRSTPHLARHTGAMLMNALTLPPLLLKLRALERSGA